MAGDLISETLEACRSVITGFKDQRRSWAARREFWALGLDECTRILDDIGLTPSEFDSAMRRPYGSEDLLHSAMESLGLDTQSFHSRATPRNRSMSRTCIACPQRRRCHDHVAALDFERHYRDFCPNRDNFAELLDERRNTLSVVRPA